MFISKFYWYLLQEDNDAPAAKVTDPRESCRLGHHSLIFDETIGVICKYCGIVEEEMKDHLPELVRIYCLS